MFHPFALAVSKSESAADFQFLFKSLRTYDLEYQPTVLMADGSDAITAGYEEVFGVPSRRLMRFIHVIKNVKPHLRGLTKGGICGKLRADTDALQICQDEATFSKAVSLFLQKWKASPKSQVREFADYFEEQWVCKYRYWFEGAAMKHPSPRMQC